MAIPASIRAHTLESLHELLTKLQRILTEFSRRRSGAAFPLPL